MSTIVKADLHQLIDQLNEGNAAEVLAYVRWLLEETTGAVASVSVPPAPVWGAPITSIEELRADFWPAEEQVDDIDATIRRWRAEAHDRLA